MHFSYSLCAVKRRPRENRLFYLIINTLIKTCNMLG